MGACQELRGYLPWSREEVKVNRTRSGDGGEDFELGMNGFGIYFEG